MRVVRAGVIHKSRADLILSLALLIGCGRVSSPEIESGGANSAGAVAAAGDSTFGGSTEGGLGGGTSAGASSAGRGGAEDAGAAGDFAGAAGESGEAELPLPADCEAHGYSTTDSSCLLRATCHGTTQSTSCQRVAPNAWQCGCGSAQPERTLEIAGAAGMKACAVAAGLCAESKLDLSKEDCSENPDYPHDDQCGLDLTCRNHVVSELPAGVQVDLVRSGRAVCSSSALPDDRGQRLFGCQCLLAAGQQSQALLADQSAHACRAALDVCLSEEPPAFGSADTCTTNAKSVPPNESGAARCSEEQICGPHAPLGGGATLVRIAEQRELSCTQLASGGSACDCSLSVDQKTSDVVGGFSFHVAEDPTVSACDPVLCSTDVVVKAVGTPGECESTDTTLGPDSCYYSFRCPVPASIGERQVLAEAPLGVICAERASDHSWLCSCRSDTETAKFELGAAASGDEACRMAPARCLTQLTLQLGPAHALSGEPPDPLP